MKQKDNKTNKKKEGRPVKKPTEKSKCKHENIKAEMLVNRCWDCGEFL